MLEIHWSEKKIKRDLIDPELYVHTKKAPANSAEEKWKWAAVGEILLCAKMLQRPILCVAPDLRRNLASPYIFLLIQAFMSVFRIHYY